MTVEEIIRERQKLASEVLDGSKEMAKLGLIVDALQAEAKQSSARKQAEYTRETSITEATYKAEVDKAQAEAGQAGPLAQAQAERAVIAAQTELAQHQAELRQQQLVAEVVKPAEAEAEKRRVLAHADADATTVQAAAAASNDRVALDRMLIEQLPQIVREASAGLAQANVNVLNGADGLAEMAAGLLTQGVRIYDSVRSMREGADAVEGHGGKGVNGSGENTEAEATSVPAAELGSA